MRELGMILFLTGAGLNAGNGFVEILVENGISLLFFGALITAIPMFVSYFIGRKLLKMDLMKSLGSICGGMTSTPPWAPCSTSLTTETASPAPMR